MPTDSAAQQRHASTVSYEFGPFRLDAGTRTLYRGDAFVALTPKAAETLLVLVEEAGRVVTKEQLDEVFEHIKHYFCEHPTISEYIDYVEFCQGRPQAV